MLAMNNLTRTLILIPIGAGLSGLAVLFGLCGAGYHRAGTVSMTLASALAFLVTVVACVLKTALFGIARQRMHDRGINASWGNANWLVLGALVALFLVFFASLWFIWSLQPVEVAFVVPTNQKGFYVSSNDPC